MEKRISGKTNLLTTFGSPIRQTESPRMYNFCFQHDNVDYAFMAFDINVEQMPKAMEAVRVLGIKGGNFTMPCKNIAAELMDELSPTAKIVGACNTFVNRDGFLTGYITDGMGFTENLRAHGFEIEGKKAVVIGAGGAGTAIQVQLALEGISEITIFNRKKNFFDRANETKEKLSKECPGVIVNVCPLEDTVALKTEIDECDILINATVVGMEPNIGESLIDKAMLRKSLVVADIVYNPHKTKLLCDAEEVGCKTIGGKGMLLRQGAVNYELFTGKKMDLCQYIGHKIKFLGFFLPLAVRR